jgi:hypothetical protein
MFCGSIPKSVTRSAFVDTATKCLATASSPAAAPSPSSSQRRTTLALVSVSRVPNVFDDTTTSVSAGSRSRVASATSVGSMLDTNRKVRSRSL